MGTLHKFICDACGYNKVVSGEASKGLVKSVITIICDTCKELYDVELADDSDVFSPDWKPPTFFCPKSKEHSVDIWKHPGPCPKCGNQMKKEPDVIEWY